MTNQEIENYNSKKEIFFSLQKELHEKFGYPGRKQKCLCLKINLAGSVKINAFWAKSQLINITKENAAEVISEMYKSGLKFYAKNRTYKTEAGALKKVLQYLAKGKF